MRIRKITPRDKQAILTSFEPLFGDWDYLPYVLDDWLNPSPHMRIWVAYGGPSDSVLIATIQAYQLAPGEWYVGALRSNHAASRHDIACAILGFRSVVTEELKDREAQTVRYGTQDTNFRSQRLGALMGFRKHFRLALKWHSLPRIPNAEGPVRLESPGDAAELLDYLRGSPSVRLLDGYVYTWWETRRLGTSVLDEALKKELLVKALLGSRLVGAGLFWHIEWMRFLVLSIMEGTDEVLKTLYRHGISVAHRLGCTAIGMTYPRMEELNRRQRLFGLEVAGEVSMQLIHVAAR